MYYYRGMFKLFKNLFTHFIWIELFNSLKLVYKCHFGLSIELFKLGYIFNFVVHTKLLKAILQ